MPPHHRQRTAPPRTHVGQALLEMTLVVSLFLLLAYGLVVVHRVIDAHLLGLTLARETARVMAEATDRSAALALGQARFRLVTAGLGLPAGSAGLLEQAILGPDSLPLAAPAFPRDGTIRVTVQVEVAVADLPFTAWLTANPRLRLTAQQPIQSFGSRPAL